MAESRADAEPWFSRQRRMSEPSEETLGGLCVRQTPYLTSYSGLRVGRDDVVSFLQQWLFESV